MSENFNEILAADGTVLSLTLARINDTVNKTYDADSNELYREDIFSDYVADLLMQQGVFTFPSEDVKQDEYFARHRFDATVNRRSVRVWGSALVRNNDEERYTLYIFASDYEPRNSVVELPSDECRKMLQEAFHFFSKSIDGSFIKYVNPQHPAWKYSRLISEKKDKIVSVKCWLFSSRVLATSSNVGRQSFPQSDVEVVLNVFDLQKLSKISEDKSGISCSFGEEGLPCFETKTEVQPYECIHTMFSGTTLAHLYSIHGTSLVEANVRAYLGENKVNKAIRETIENEPENFLAYNNGLVISATSAKVEDDRLLELEGVQIVNGGQTTATIYQTWLTAKNNRRNKERVEHIEKNLDLLRVPAKIIVPPDSMTDEEKLMLMKGISVAANSQSKVNISDLSANSMFQIELGKAITSIITPENDHWFYERSRGLYKAEIRKLKGNSVGKSKFEKEYPSNKKIDKTDIALSSLCWDGLVCECSKGKEYAFKTFEGKKESSLTRNGACKVSQLEAKRFIAKWIIFSRVQEEVKKDTSLRIGNPRVPVVYAISLLARRYGDNIRWDAIWSKQDISYSFINEMKKLTAIVYAIMKKHMGDSMISMWGRQLACKRTLDADFSFEKYPELRFDRVYEIS